MPTTIYDVLEELRGSATSEADKGSKLERLIAAYLRTDPMYAEQFDACPLLPRWPLHGGRCLGVAAAGCVDGGARVARANASPPAGSAPHPPGAGCPRPWPGKRTG